MFDSLLSEVDADVRAERAAQLWARWRRPLYAAIVAAIALAAGDSIWQHYAEKRGGERMEQLTAAHALYTQGNPKEAAEAFAAVAADTGGELATLATLWQGRALVAANEKDAAIAAFTAAATGAPGLWSDLACLRLASLDNAAAKDCLASTKETPLLNQRREWQAANQWAAGEREQAIATLEELATSPETSKEASTQINQWLGTLRAEPSQKAE